jgi:hypothetical protein
MGWVERRKLTSIDVLEALVESMQTQISAWQMDIKLRLVNIAGALYESQ